MSSRRGAIAFAAVAAVAAAIGIGCYGFGLLHGLELGSVDTRFSVRGDQEPSPELAIVGIDDDTFSELKLQWPFPRRLHAKVIDRLVEDGAKAIAFDVQFTEATDPRDDNALVEAVQRAGNVVLATSEVSAQGKHAVFGGNAVLRQIGARAGNTVYIPDSDGTVRRFPYALQNLESFAVAAAEVGDGRIRRRRRLRRARGGAWIDYAGPPKTFPTYSYSTFSTAGSTRTGSRTRSSSSAPPRRSSRTSSDPIRRRTDVGGRDPGERDRDRPRRRPAALRPGLAQHRPDPAAGRDRPPRRIPHAAGDGPDRRRSGRRWSSSPSASSPSTPGRSSPSSARCSRWSSARSAPSRSTTCSRPSSASGSASPSRASSPRTSSTRSSPRAKASSGSAGCGANRPSSSATCAASPATRRRASRARWSKCSTSTSGR